MNGQADAGCNTTDRPLSEHQAAVSPATYWPYLSYLELGAFPSAVPSSRLHARLVVAEWGLGELAEVVELIASELVTNAMYASQGLFGNRFLGRWSPGPPPVRLWLQADNERVLIQVWDASDRMPQLNQSESLSDNGRGLVLVEALSTKSGVYLLEGSSGKVVWAEVSAEG
jgi:hypothetical protein